MSTIEVGNIIEGTVVGVQSFGAFVSIGENKQGLVHISQISSQYVEDINQVLKVNDQVRVKVTEIKPDGKISLTMRIDEEPKQNNRPPRKRDDRGFHAGPRGGSREGAMPNRHKEDFESMMKKWAKNSEDRMSDLGKREKRK
ncbi:S1 RNA-binding domain-containing protein [Ammoniphilus resinae]|uniref:General stress protein 13/S1 RNA binding domain protein n=1 Tax=Ammoniphilus resinae TaxID=861532 RepID=A0ABS4GUL9_9BACL|nr:S1 RNA-binding domain-containing protein [Ammoniphilus resinae]MBP1933742.1 general stress protein 13/S1 RNA binding domain protein [Ammoniphilus resinae]